MSETVEETRRYSRDEVTTAITTLRAADDNLSHRLGLHLTTVTAGGAEPGQLPATGGYAMVVGFRCRRTQDRFNAGIGSLSKAHPVRAALLSVPVRQYVNERQTVS